MSINLPNRILKSKIIYIIVGIMVMGSLSLYIFRNPIWSFYWERKCPSPLVWHKIRISLPEGMIYKKDGKSVGMFYWKGEPEGYIFLRSLSIQDPKRFFDFLEKEGFVILESRAYTFKGYNSYLVDYKTKANQIVFKGILIPSLQLYINYEGPKKNYQYFEDVIDKLDFGV